MTHKKFKVLLFLFGGVGGAERMTVNIGKMLPRDRYEVKFVVCGRLAGILKFIPSDYEKIRIPWHNIHVFPRLRMGYVMLKEKPDFVFSSVAMLNVILLQTSSFLNIRCIVRNDNMVNYVGAKLQKKMSRTYKNAYRVIAQQEEMQQDLIELIGTDENHVVCLHNPLDNKNILPKLYDPSPYPNDDSINYLWVANYLESKGHDILTEAFKIVHSRNSKSHLYFVGKIDETLPNYIKTKELVAKAKLEKYVHFVGLQVNPYKWMKYCDCFVLPSRIEGLPNVLIEAMYLKRPVVASVCIPVIDRMVQEGVNGYKVLPEQPEAMADAMEKALNLKECKMTFPLASDKDFISLFN